VVDYLLANNFNFNDIINSFKEVQKATKENRPSEVFDESITIYEGSQAIVKTKAYKRSAKLREKAIQFYTVNDRVKCQACCFDFEDFYGEYGKNLLKYTIKNLFSSLRVTT